MRWLPLGLAVSWIALSLLGCSTSESSPRSHDDTSAEGAEGPSGGSSEGLGLLSLPKVQDDLRLRPNQKTQILALQMERQKASVNAKEKLAEILDPTQLKRLKQIRLQVSGVHGINSHEVAMALGLTRTQRHSLTEIQEEVRHRVMNVLQELHGLTADERRAKMPNIVKRLELIRQETTADALRQLTPEQRTQLEKMQGLDLQLTVSPGVD